MIHFGQSTFRQNYNKIQSWAARIISRAGYEIKLSRLLQIIVCHTLDDRRMRRRKAALMYEVHK